MELGIYHEFPVLPGHSQAECFAAGFDIVDASEEYGLDVMWLAELHFDKPRALVASPLVLGTAIAARTERIRIGTSVQVLPLANPLRIAEEAATLDHVSKGRLIFGVGRSGVVKTYEALNIAYSESKDREIECLEIIQRAWSRRTISPTRASFTTSKTSRSCRSRCNRKHCAVRCSLAHPIRWWAS